MLKNNMTFEKYHWYFLINSTWIMTFLFCIGFECLAPKWTDRWTNAVWIRIVKIIHSSRFPVEHVGWTHPPNTHEYTWKSAHNAWIHGYAIFVNSCKVDHYLRRTFRRTRNATKLKWQTRRNVCSSKLYGFIINAFANPPYAICINSVRNDSCPNSTVCRWLWD